MSDKEDISTVDMVESMMSELEDWIVEIEMRGSDYDARMAVLLSGAATRHVDMDTPVKIKDAIYLPELGGVWTESMEFSVPSQTHAVKTIRNAILSGALGVERPDEKRQLLTRNLLQEWRTSCQEKPSPQDSFSEKTAATPMVRSHTKLNGASTTEAKKLTQDAARATLMALKNR